MDQTQKVVDSGFDNVFCNAAMGMKDRQDILKERPIAFFSVEKRYLRKKGSVFRDRQS